MCGIAGYISQKPKDHSAWLRSAADEIRHRGPDDFGFSLEAQGAMRFLEKPSGAGRIGLAHRRLSILDLSPEGRQPMLSEKGLHALTFNGEIYNYLELRKELEANGRVFRSSSDTEVLLALLIDQGVAALPKLRGMFSFCFVDLVHGTFLLGRDPFGIKPLYFIMLAGEIRFCSEVGPLRSVRGVDCTTPAQQLFNFIRFGVADDSRTTLAKGIAQVPPGHFLAGNLDSPAHGEIKCYWQPRLAWRKDISFEEAKEEIRRRFINSVRLHLRADVPVGAALSGGVDSSAIVCTMRHLEPEASIHTFTYAARGHAFDESHWAKSIAEHVGAKQHITEFTTEELVADIPRLLAVQEDPFGSTSIYAQYRIFKSVSETPVKVMLDGQGGDETMAGYGHYLGAHLAHLLRSGQMTEILSLAKHKRDAYGWKIAIMHLLPEWLERLGRKVVGKQAYPNYLKEDWFKRQGVIGKRLESRLDKTGVMGTLWDNVNRSLLPQLLHFEDRNSMAFSIESRVPFLETDFVEFALSLPGQFHISRKGVTKHVFKEAMRGLVPDAILDRKDKIGFQTPGRAILTQAAPWVVSTMDAPISSEQPWLDLNALRATYRRICKGELTNQHEQGFWRVICYLNWLNLR